jgi:uncharacterized protein (TIGR03089 family)
VGLARLAGVTALDVTTDRPLLTYHDAATGERVDLSAPDLGRWAAQTAALLRQGCGLGPGARAAVLLPPHWHTAAVLLGAWSAGIAVSFRPWATAGLQPSDEVDAVFVSPERADSWLETVPTATYRFVVGAGPVPHGYRDYLAEVGRQSDAPPAYGLIRPGDAASPDGTSYREWAAIAQEIAGRLGLRADDRLLVDVAVHEQPVAWLLAPLMVGASVVLVANLDPADVETIAAAEGITHRL